MFSGFSEFENFDLRTNPKNDEKDTQTGTIP
jgi:hypothetical protein